MYEVSFTEALDIIIPAAVPNICVVFCPEFSIFSQDFPPEDWQPSTLPAACRNLHGKMLLMCRNVSKLHF